MKLLLFLTVAVHGAFSAPVGTCTEGWTLNASGDRCFYISFDPVASWVDAQSNCSGLNSDLASLTDGAETFASLMNTASEMSRTKFWIDDTEDTNDVPDDGSVKQPGQQCSYVEYKSNQEVDFEKTDCATNDYGFICVKDLASASTAAPTSAVTFIPTNVDLAGNPIGDASDQNDTIMLGSPMMELLEAIAVPSCRQNWFLDPTGTKCYFIAPAFVSGSFFETSVFCDSLGGSVVQPSTLDEFNAVDNFTHSISNWTQGPWVGLVRPFGDDRIILANSGIFAPDDLTGNLSTLISLNDTKSNCGGYGPGGNSTFQFYDCSELGNPFCEMPPFFTIIPVNMTLIEFNNAATNNTATGNPSQQQKADDDMDN